MGRQVELVLWDTAGQEDYANLRPVSYPDSHVILMCFAVNQPASFRNIQDTWIPEVRLFCPGVPIILVATKSDLREDESSIAEDRLISTAEGLRLSNAVSTTAYMECSSKSGDNVYQVFQTAARAALMHRKKSLLQRATRSSCNIL